MGKSNGNNGPLWESTQVSRNEFETFISTRFCGLQKCKKCKCAKASMKCITNCVCGRKCNNVYSEYVEYI